MKDKLEELQTVLSAEDQEQPKGPENNPESPEAEFEALSSKVSLKEEQVNERLGANANIEAGLVASLAVEARSEASKEIGSLNQEEAKKVNWFKSMAANIKETFRGRNEGQALEANTAEMLKGAAAEAEAGQTPEESEKGLEAKPWFAKMVAGVNKAIDFDFDSLKAAVAIESGDSNQEKAAKWAGKAALAIPKIALSPVKFCKDAAMATVRSVDNNRKLNSLKESLDGTNPEKLLAAMKLDKGSAEYKTIAETLNSDDPETKKLALDAVAKRLSREGQARLNQKTKVGNYLTLGEQVAGNPQEGKQDDKVEVGVWNFTSQKSSLADKKAIAAKSFKDGMLMHLLKDPTEIAALATCTINGEYVSNLAKMDVKDVLESKNTAAALARDLEMIKNIKSYPEEMQAKIRQSFSLSDKEDRLDLLKKSTASGSYTASTYIEKQAKTIAYLGLRKTVGMAVDVYKFSADKHKESILASEIANSGLTEGYAKLMSKLDKGAPKSPEEQKQAEAELAAEGGQKLLHLSEGGANLLLDKTVNALIKNKDKDPMAIAEEIDFLKKFSDFAKYQTDKGKMDVAKLDQINSLIKQYKLETASADPEKIKALDQAGYDASSFACKKTGKLWRDMAIRDKNHSKFMSKNRGNLMAAYIGYQADRLASLGFQAGGLGELGSSLGMDQINFGGGIALEHIALENIQNAVHMIPDNVVTDAYGAAKGVVAGASHIMSSDTVLKAAGGILSSEAMAASPVKEGLKADSKELSIDSKEADKFKKVNNFDANKFEFSPAQKEANLELAKSFINQNADYLKNSLKNIVIKAGCDERNASPELMKLDKALAAKDENGIKKGLEALGIKTETDIKKFRELAGKSDPGDKITGNYSLHVLRSMTMLSGTIEAINKSNLTKGQKERAIRNIKVEIVRGGITVERGGAKDAKEYQEDRYNQLEIESKSEWTIGKDESIEVLIDNSPSGEKTVSASAAFFRDYVNMNKDLIVGEASITATRFSGSEKEIDPGNSASRENNYKTFLKIDKGNISQLDVSKEVKDNINGKGSSSERMLKNTITKLSEIKASGKKTDKIFVVSDEGFQKDLTLKNLRDIQKLKQETGVKEVYFVIFNDQGVPNKIEAGEILQDLAKLSGMGEEKAKEFLFTQSAHVAADGEVVRYSEQKGDELLDKSRLSM